MAQLIDGQGCMSGDSLKELLVGHDDYAIVSIMGPQSSGKSTLMNKVASPARSNHHRPLTRCAARPLRSVPRANRPLAALRNTVRGHGCLARALSDDARRMGCR